MESTFDAIILGGGFAGLSCAAALAEAGLRALVLEKKPHLGGRAYSFIDPQSGQTVDNGQHLFMGCYRHTRRFLERIRTDCLLKFPERIRVDFADSSGGRDALRCPRLLGSPLHLAWGILAMRGLPWKDKWGLLRLNQAMKGFRRDCVPAGLDQMTVREWLDSLGQSRRIQERLFDPIALGALNDEPAIAAATGFAQVLREIFFRDVESTRLGLSSVGLSELYTRAARDYIEQRGGRVLVSKRATALVDKNGGAAGVVTEPGERYACGAIVSTLPPWDLKRLELPEALRGSWEGLKPSPIVSLCLWLDRPVIEEALVGMIGTEIQWVFNKSLIFGDRAQGQYLSLVISGAHRHVGRDPKALLAIAQKDLSRCFPAFRKARIRRWKAVKEPFATLSPVPGSDALRPGALSVVPGFYFAGDWTRTGLPATIESAVSSGHRAAELILERHSASGGGRGLARPVSGKGPG